MLVCTVYKNDSTGVSYHCHQHLGGGGVESGSVLPPASASAPAALAQKCRYPCPFLAPDALVEGEMSRRGRETKEGCQWGGVGVRQAAKEA